MVECPVTVVLLSRLKKNIETGNDMLSKATNKHMGMTKNLGHFIPALSLSHLPLTLPAINESINAVNLIGYWCHDLKL